MSKKYGECGKHPGQNMVNCVYCGMEQDKKEMESSIEKTPQQNAEEWLDKNISEWPTSIEKLAPILENYAQSVGVSEEEWFKLISKLDIIYAQEHSEMQGLTMSKEDLAEAGKVSDHYEKRKIELIKQSLSTQPQPKEEEKCKHDRREKVRDLKGWYCLDCGYDHITYERG